MNLNREACVDCRHDLKDVTVMIERAADAVRPIKPTMEDAPFEIIRPSTDGQGRIIVDFQGIYIFHDDACKLRDELNRLLPDPSLHFAAEAWRCDSFQLERMVKTINAAMPDFRSLMGSECDHAELALNALIEQRDKLAQERDELRIAMNALLKTPWTVQNEQAMRQAMVALGLKPHAPKTL